MPENNESEDDVEYIETDEITLSLDSNLLDVLITEEDLHSSPVINAESDTRSGVVAVHLPLQVAWLSKEDTGDLPFSDNFVHTQMSTDKARELINQLETAVEEVESKQEKRTEQNKG